MGQSSTKRVLTVLEERLYKHVIRLADRDGVSVSQKVRDLVVDAVERDEDADLLSLVESRRKKGGKLIPHDDFWKKAAG